MPRSNDHLLVGLGTLAATLSTAPLIERGVLIGIAVSLIVQRVTRRCFAEPDTSPAVGR